jgi:hypothetical protein
METQFGLYPKFYVKRKNVLFPLMEKYSGESLKGKSHSHAIQLYYSLLRTNEQFRAQVDDLITAQNFKSASGGWNYGGDVGGAGATVRTPTTTKTKTGAGAAIFGGVLGFIGNTFGLIAANKAAKAQSDQAFMDIVLNEQKKDDTTKILIISGITLAFIAIGGYMVIKLRK